MAQPNDAKLWRQDVRDARAPSSAESARRAPVAAGSMKRYSSTTRLRRFIAGEPDEFAGLENLDRAELDEDDAGFPQSVS